MIATHVETIMNGLLNRNGSFFYSFGFFLFCLFCLLTIRSVKFNCCVHNYVLKKVMSRKNLPFSLFIFVSLQLNLNISM